MKKQWKSYIALLTALFLTGCGEDEGLSEYQTDMETFFEHLEEYNDNMNAIDVNQPDYLSQMLTYLDELDAEVAGMAALEVPEQFAAVESLADEASDNMTQAVSYYHMAYESEEYNESVEQAAKEYYDRANQRIQYIVTILHGEIPEGEGVIYTEENKIFGGGYLNQTDDESGAEENGESGSTSSEQDNAGNPAQDDGAEDNFDTDDTVFYEE